MVEKKEHLSLRERLILRILLFIVDWLSRSCDDIHNFEIGRIMEEFDIKDKRIQWRKQMKDETWIFLFIAFCIGLCTYQYCLVQKLDNISQCYCRGDK